MNNYEDLERGSISETSFVTIDDDEEIKENGEIKYRHPSTDTALLSENTNATRRSYFPVENNHIQRRNGIVKYFPFFCILILLSICKDYNVALILFFLSLSPALGIIYFTFIQIENPGGIAKMNVSEQISPNDSSWWFYTITPYSSSCNDVRNNIWRLISVQFVHRKNSLLRFLFLFFFLHLSLL
jgi:hypothetical protein